MDTIYNGLQDFRFKGFSRNHTRVAVFFAICARTSLGDPIEVGAVRKAGSCRVPCATSDSNSVNDMEECITVWTGSNQRAPTRTIADS